MNLAALADSLTPPAQPVFSDGFGERRQAIGARGERLEVLRLSSTLTATPNVETALRERVARLSSFRHDSFQHPRAIDVDSASSTLVVYSEHVSGVRLSSLLAAAEKRSLSLDLNAVRCLLRQLLSAAAAWYEALPDISHGAIGPERIIVTPNGRLVVADCVLGSALGQLRYTRDRYWSELRVALPPAPAVHAFDARTDVAQVGLVALALILGRRLTSDIYPGALSTALQGAALRVGNGPVEPLPLTVRDWLRRAMQLDPRDGFATAREAAVGLSDAIGKEEAALDRDALHVFLARCLALDMRASAGQIAGSDDAPLTLDAIDDVASEVDLAPRIEALRAFLARYPSNPSTGATKPPAAPPSTLVEEVTETPSILLKEEPTSLPSPDAQPSDVSATITAPSPIEEEPPANTATRFDFHSHARRIAMAVPGDWSQRVRIGAIAIVALGSLVVAWFALGLLRSTRVEPPGTVSITTNPAGVAVTIDSVRRGVTPLDVDLPAGTHLVAVPTDRGPRQIPVTIKSGSQMSLFLELTAPAPAATGNGELLVRTEPLGASVTVDGRSVGRSPVSVADLTPGPHTVVLAGPSGSVTQRVLVEPGRTASLLVPMGDRQVPGAAAGWIAVAAPADVQVFEGDRFLGNNRIDKIMLPVGRHDLDIVNETLGYRERRTVQVAAGQVTSIKPNWPKGTLAINAVPWAEVFVDGMPAGETPIGSIQVTLGVHEVVFRHPELGERRATVTVTSGSPAKVGVDLRSK